MDDIDGIYGVFTTGTDGQGSFVIVLFDGIMCGADLEGVRYDGNYRMSEGLASIKINFTVSIPPNCFTIQGVRTGASGLEYNVATQIPMNFYEIPFVSIETPIGPVNVKFRRLRELTRNGVA
jgi:hypothetical protein